MSILRKSSGHRAVPEQPKVLQVPIFETALTPQNGHFTRIHPYRWGCPALNNHQLKLVGFD